MRLKAKRRTAADCRSIAAIAALAGWTAASAFWFASLERRKAESAPESASARLNLAEREFAQAGAFVRRRSNENARPLELLHPRFLRPRPEAFLAKARPWLALTTADCALAESRSSASMPAALGPELGRKLREWHGWLCLKRPLPRDFFERAPLTHPLGGSWAKAAADAGGSPLPPTKALHAFELRGEQLGELTEQERALTALPRALAEAMLEGQPLARAEGRVVYLLEAIANAIGYAVLPEDAFKQILSRYSLRESPLEGERICYAPRGDVCLSVDSRRLRQENALFAGNLGALALVAVGSAAWGARQRRKLREALAREKEVVARNMLHELRQPAQGLAFAQNRFAEEFDALPESLQEEYGRMASWCSDLKEVLRMSEDYLKLGEAGRSIASAVRRLDGATEWFEATTEPFVRDEANKIDRDAPESLPALSTDPYWLSVALRNLIRNALAHGKAPVRVRARDLGGRVRFEVEDAGPGLAPLRGGERFQAFRKGSESQGLGLGLSLVQEISEKIGCEFEHRSNPSTFSLTVRSYDA